MIKLIQLSIYDGIDIYNMLQRIGSNEGEFHNDVNGISYNEFKKWLILQDNWSKGVDLPLGYVKQWTFWLYNDDRPVGYGKLRESVTKESMKFGGNIGFAIDPLYRGKGYGNILFSELLYKAKELKILEIYSTVENYNTYSKMVHQKYGGKIVFEDNSRYTFLFKIK